MADPQKTVIAFDFGDKRIGIAVASVISQLPQPSGFIEQSETLFDDIAELAKSHNAVAAVVGLPRNLEGKETAQTAVAREFSEELISRLDIPVYLQDEAVTSRQAEEELRARNAKYNKGDVDALAATYILTDFLREHPGDTL
jgi:putative Holliday junction resolvase